MAPVQKETQQAGAQKKKTGREAEGESKFRKLEATKKKDFVYS